MGGNQDLSGGRQAKVDREAEKKSEGTDCGNRGYESRETEENE